MNILMKKTLFAGILIASFFFVTNSPVVHSITVAELQAQINALMAQFAALQAQQNTGSTSSGGGGAVVGPGTITVNLAPFCGLTPTQILSIGSRGTEVTNLQRFLVSLGLLSSSSVTGYYGIQTDGAVSNFQVSYGVLPAGITSPGQGTTGPLTRAKMSEVACMNVPQGTTSTGVPTGIPAPISTTPPAGTSFIDLKANGSDGPLTISPAEPLIISWKASSDFVACKLNEGGVDAQYNNVQTYKPGDNLYPPRSFMSGGAMTYKIVCDKYDSRGFLVPTGSVSDSVSVSLDPTPFTIMTPEAGKVFNVGDPVNVTWKGADYGISSYVVALGTDKLLYTNYPWLSNTYIPTTQKSFAFKAFIPGGSYSWDGKPANFFISFRPSTYPIYNTLENKSPVFTIAPAGTASANATVTVNQPQTDPLAGTTSYNPSSTLGTPSLTASPASECGGKILIQWAPVIGATGYRLNGAMTGLQPGGVVFLSSSVTSYVDTITYPQSGAWNYSMNATSNNGTVYGPSAPIVGSLASVQCQTSSNTSTRTTLANIYEALKRIQQQLNSGEVR